METNEQKCETSQQVYLEPIRLVGPNLPSILKYICVFLMFCNIRKTHFMTRLQTIRNVPDQSNSIIYYSMHIKT